MGAAGVKPEVEEDSENAPDGTLDERTTTRTQRYVFTKNLHLIDDDIKRRYLFLRNPKNRVAGKQTEINQIINSHVDRAATGKMPLSVRQKTLQKFRNAYVKSEEGHMAEGLDWYVLIGTTFAGNETLATKAFDAGQVIEKDGKFYTSTHQILRSRVTKDGYAAHQCFGNLEDTKTFLGLMSELQDELEEEDIGLQWIAFAEKKQPNQAALQGVAGEAEEALMQDSCMYARLYM